MFPIKISTKGRYALRLMLDLAVHNTGEFIPLKEVAARQEISEKYLEQIITPLNRAGYLRSVRGTQGGYRLARDPKEYTVGMILRLMEGDLSVVACLEGEQNLCERASHCVTVEVWQRITLAIEEVVDHITLSDLVDRYREKAGCDYCI